MSRAITLVLTAMSFLLVACPYDPTHPLLKVRNSGDDEIVTLLNVLYPDSSLKSSRVDTYIEPGLTLYVGDYYELNEYPGITLFIFNHDYFQDRWNEGVGTPDTYLDEDSALIRYYLSRKQLDSLDWKLTYP